MASAAAAYAASSNIATSKNGVSEIMIGAWRHHGSSIVSLVMPADIFVLRGDNDMAAKIARRGGAWRRA